MLSSASSVDTRIVVAEAAPVHGRTRVNPYDQAIAVRVTENPAEHRYEVHADGVLAGFAVYRLRPGRISFVHTEIEDEFEGQGLASKLISEALDDAGSRELSVLPFCPFVNAYIKRHPEYVDLVPESDRERFGF